MGTDTTPDLEGAAAPRSASAGAPPGLAERGLRLWGALELEGLLAGSSVVLAEEACRVVDRLEKLDQLLRGEAESWASIKSYDDDRPSELVINGAMGEARQQQLTLKQLLAQLLPKTAASAPAVPAPGGTGGGVDDLQAARARRIAEASGTAPS